MGLSALFGKKREGETSPREGAESPLSGGASSDSARLVQPRGAAGAITHAPGSDAVRGLDFTADAAAMNARDVARATAEKIDRIESEMALDFTVRNPKPSGSVSGSQAPANGEPARPAGSVPSSTPARPRKPFGSTTTISLGQSTDILLGDSILANALELSDSASNPAIEEAAILYANGQGLPAVAVLRDAIRNDTGSLVNAAATQPWLMLFELYQLLGKKAEFENLSIDYSVRFDLPAPFWVEGLQATGSGLSSPRPVDSQVGASHDGRPVIRFAGPLDRSIIPTLDQLKRLAQKSPLLWLEFDAVTAVDAAGADLILRVLAAFQKSNHEVVIRGASSLLAVCHKAVETGRRDPSSAVWILLLEALRLTNQQSAFEEASIDYCVTYEVSPPAFEPPSKRFRIDDSAPPQATPDEEAEVERTDAVVLQGDLVGKLEGELQRLNQFAAGHDHVVVDCARLKRVDFTAAGALLNWSVGMQGAGNQVQFQNVGHLVAALFVVMGLHEVAQVERRKV